MEDMPAQEFVLEVEMLENLLILACPFPNCRISVTLLPYAESTDVAIASWLRHFDKEWFHQ